jgi:Cof subfamily protein (haloacid dehalogenase superfamily)
MVRIQRTLHVSDLDFTLLRSDGSVSTYTTAVVNELVSNGGLFTVATARSLDSVKRVCAGLDLRLPIITYGGCLTVDEHGIISDIRFLPTTAAEALRAAVADEAAHPAILTFEHGRDWIRWHPGSMSAALRGFLGARAGDRRLREITEADPLDWSTVFYVSILGTETETAAVRQRLSDSLRTCSVFHGPDPSTPETWWLEFHDASSTKADAVARLARELGATQVVVFGDNNNDLPMFGIADVSYAVANAAAQVQEAATGVIGSNDEDGVARWIARSID